MIIDGGACDKRESVHVLKITPAYQTRWNRRASGPSNLCVPPAAVILGGRGCLARIVVHRWGFSERDVDHVDRLYRSARDTLTLEGPAFAPGKAAGAGCAGLGPCCGPSGAADRRVAQCLLTDTNSCL